MDKNKKEGVFDHLYKSVTTNTTIQKSLKIGASVAAATSLGHLLWRGRPDRAVLVFAFIFVPTAMGTSLYIDYQNMKQKLKTQQYEVALRHRMLTDGTADDPKSNSNS